MGLVDKIEFFQNDQAHQAVSRKRTTIRVDFSKYTLAAADTMKILYIPANTRVHFVEAKVLVAEGGAATLDVGDSAQAEGWIKDLDVNTVATLTTHIMATGGAVENYTPATIYLHGKFYMSADYLVVDASAELDTAIVDITVEYSSYQFLPAS